MKQLSALGARRHAFFRSPRRMRPLGGRLDESEMLGSTPYTYYGGNEHFLDHFPTDPLALGVVKHWDKQNKHAGPPPSRPSSCLSSFLSSLLLFLPIDLFYPFPGSFLPPFLCSLAPRAAHGWLLPRGPGELRRGRAAGALPTRTEGALCWPGRAWGRGAGDSRWPQPLPARWVDRLRIRWRPGPAGKARRSRPPAAPELSEIQDGPGSDISPGVSP